MDLHNDEDADRIVSFWNQGMASSFETQLIELFLRADHKNTRLLASVYPAIYAALRRKGYGI